MYLPAHTNSKWKRGRSASIRRGLKKETNPFQHRIMKSVYTFPNGTKIDLLKVYCIGDIDKDVSSGLIFIPVFCTGSEKPMRIPLGNYFGKVPEDKKQDILIIYMQFVAAWEAITVQEFKDNN